MTPELEEKLGRAYCTLNKWGWDELCGPKPDGFDSMTDDEKSWYIDPAMRTIESMIGDAGTNRAWWLYELHATEDDWAYWYVYGQNHPDEYFEERRSGEM